MSGLQEILPPYPTFFLGVSTTTNVIDVGNPEFTNKSILLTADPEITEVIIDQILFLDYNRRFNSQQLPRYYERYFIRKCITERTYRLYRNLAQLILEMLQH